MRTISQLLLSFLLNACWQVVVVFAFAALCSWLLQSTAAKYRHAVWVAALLLSLGLPLFSSLPKASSSLATTSETVIAPVTIEPFRQTEVVTLTPHIETGPIRISSGWALLLFSIYIVVSGSRTVRLAVAWKRTRTIVRTAVNVDSAARIQTVIDGCRKAIGVDEVRVLFSNAVHVPITAGGRKPSIILPEKFLSEADIDLLTSGIGHELIHVRRRDYILNLFYEIVYVPLSFHPAAVFIKRRIGETRELCCDELVAEKLQNARVYARSLVQLAASAPRSNPVALTTTVGITDADNLEVRVMSLLKRPTLNVRRKRLLLIAASLLLAVPCVASAAFALKFDIDPLASPQDQKVKDERVEVVYRPRPEYPEQAREKKIEGTVKLLLTVDSKGSVQGVEVTKPVDPLLDAAAVKSVREWKFSPFQVDGQPVTRKLNADINFSLNSWQQEKSREALEKLEREKSETGYQNPELMRRRQLELEARAKAQAELARHARISMDQAVQIATSKYPGTVMECSLIAERWESTGVLAKDAEVFYHLTILSPNDQDSSTVHVWVSALDGRIVRSEKEKRSEYPPPPPPGNRPISGGVLNGTAISLPAPQYPEIARAARAEGTVTVTVVIDELGNVVEAAAIAGHPLLQSAAVTAARQAKFNPTKLEGEAVRVRGTLTYNFVMQ